ncbi:MAG: PQQ-dependent sugar dehydrogenase [Planctomycetes bacterium]|nr:PQQ-dependent sugar dehydrogenase [Planctomycetota bacterium]
MINFCVLILMASQAQEADYYSVEFLPTPAGETIEVGGVDFLSDGTMLLSTRRGRVWWVDNAMADDLSQLKFHIFAEGLHEGLGLEVVDDEIYVMQRGELSRLIDLDGDQICDRIESVSQDWGMTGNYHEFAFGAPVDEHGNFYISTNVGFWSPQWWHGKSKAPRRGTIMKVAPNGDTTWFASGVRSPCGLGVDSEQRVLYTDNQGDWMPVCGIFDVEQDDFFGHPASLRWTDEYNNGEIDPSSTEAPTRQPKSAAVWIPYDWSRSTGNLVHDSTAAKFGPFKDQLFVAELTLGNVLRVMLEDVQGVTQGAVVKFRSAVGSAVRVRFAPDGSLFAGLTNRGWGGRAPGSGIARIRYRDNLPLEMQNISLRQDGFVIDLTKAIDSVPAISARSYDYNYWWDYGSPEMRDKELSVPKVSLSDDGMQLTLSGMNLKAGRCVRLQLSNIGLLHDEFSYTINQLPEGEFTTERIAKTVAPPAARTVAEEGGGWLTTTWGDPFDNWTGEGWKLCSATVEKSKPNVFEINVGNSALVNVDPNSAPFTSKDSYGDVEFRFSFMLPEGGDSGLYMMSRYELQLADNDSCGAIIGSKNPRAQAYNGPGEWHVMRGRFLAPRFDADGNKTRNARFEDISIDYVSIIGAAECKEVTGGAISQIEVASAPMFFQANAGSVAIADVRLKPLD